MDPMEQVPSNAPQTAARPQKFKKNTSLSSIATHSDLYFEDETACRKITIEQKHRFVELITQENFNMKEV